MLNAFSVEMRSTQKQDRDDEDRYPVGDEGRHRDALDADVVEQARDQLAAIGGRLSPKFAL